MAVSGARSKPSLSELLRAKAFLVLRKLKPARERVTLGEKNDHVEREHVERYKFAQRFCAGKRVGDIACGTGYGSAILREVASSVDGYDKEPLCGNFVLDLEKQDWGKPYDVIVSFETIEHLANPEFFLENARRSARMLVVSTPIGEFLGYNPHHKQVWKLPEFTALLQRYFPRITYYYQNSEEIVEQPPQPVRFVLAVCTAD